MDKCSYLVSVLSKCTTFAIDPSVRLLLACTTLASCRTSSVSGCFSSCCVMYYTHSFDFDLSVNRSSKTALAKVGLPFGWGGLAFLFDGSSMD